MRIQEMRSGFSHLKKKAEAETSNNVYEMQPAPQRERHVEEAFPAPQRSASELEVPIWAVVSFDKVEASPLTYCQAEDWLAELSLQGVPGLCIVTLETAKRVTA